MRTRSKLYSLCLSMGLALAAMSGTCQELLVFSPRFARLNSGSRFPFHIGVGMSMRYQQVYGASDFALVMLESGYITTLRFDLASRVDGGMSFSSVLPEIQINLSTTSKQPDGLSAVFSENVGPNDTVVFGPGPIALSDDGVGGYDVIIPLATPFLYEPAAGNLLMDVRNIGGGTTSFLFAYADSTDASSIAWELSVNATSGFLTSHALATAFEVTPIPEPGTSILILLGFAGACWRLTRSLSKSRCHEFA